MIKKSHTVKCDACGASSVIHRKHVFECQYCGSHVMFTTSNEGVVSQHQSIKYTKLLVFLLVLFIAVLVVFWFVFKNTAGDKSIDQSVPVIVKQNIITQTKPPPEVTLIDKKTKSLGTAGKNSLLIFSQIKGTTTNDGLYWVLGLENVGDETIYRPGAVVSLFDSKGLRVAEQSGWSMLEYLKPGEKTAALVFLPNVPIDVARHQLTSLVSEPNSFVRPPLALKVQNFVVSETNNSFEIIGDVFNENDVPVKFTRVLAVAKNKSGEPIGLGNAFATNKTINAYENSGFKIKVGTFLQGQPDHWDVYAVARQ